MDRLSSILVVVERSDLVRRALAKAIILARHFGARLELFLCDAEHAHEFRHLDDVNGVQKARRALTADAMRYLESVRNSVAARDVPISLDVTCDSPMHVEVARKVRGSGPDLVIKSSGDAVSAQHRRLSASDWQLVRTCPVPLMVTRGRPWHPQPRFVAAVDVSGEASPGMANAIVHAAGYLARGCKGDLDVVYGESPTHGSGPACESHQRALASLTRELCIDQAHVHVLHGDPLQVLPGFALEHDYDVLALGALNHGRVPSAPAATLTGRLLDALDCDFVHIKPTSLRTPGSSARQAPP